MLYYQFYGTNHTQFFAANPLETTPDGVSPRLAIFYAYASKVDFSDDGCQVLGHNNARDLLTNAPTRVSTPHS